MYKCLIAAFMRCSMLVALSTQVLAASFDCIKASSETEKLICADPELSALDMLMTEKYLSIEDSKPIAEQRSWLSQRNKCDEKACLKEAIINRIDELDAIIDGHPNAEKSFQCEIAPTQFKVYNEGGAYGDWFLVLETGETKLRYEVEWDTAGTGVCRYWIYKFNIDEVFYSLEELGRCSGPDGLIVPKGSVAELRSDELKFTFFCTDPYQGLFQKLMVGNE